MKKPNKRKRQNAPKQNNPVSQKPAKLSRREFLSKAGTIAGGVVLVGGIGFWGARTVQASVAERDLTEVGQGIPTIVQVHDPQCEICIALQREVRVAFEDFDQDALAYRVADIKTDTGLAFAGQYGAVHSTLLFFDERGNLSQRLVGPNNSATLARAFAAHRDARR